MSSRPAAPVRLLAIDIDGTLLRNDGTVAPADRDAIAGALARGIAVTLATGRLSSSTLPFARQLALDVPLVCADGAVLFCPTRRLPLSQVALAAPGLSALLDALRASGLSSFVFTHESVCGAAADFERFPFVSGWTPQLEPHDDLLGALAAAGGRTPITAIGVGPEKAVVEALRLVRAHPDIADEVTAFPIRGTEHWVLRLTPGGISKAVGLARVAANLGVEAGEVATVGDYYNDVAMFEWSGWSFAMGQAPDDVKKVARRTLQATAATGGGVAEALAYLAAWERARDLGAVGEGGAR